MNRTLSPLRIALIYAGLGAMWILVSDTLAELWFPGPVGGIPVQMLKGLLFVLVTSALVYGLVRMARRESDRARSWYAELFESGPEAMFITDPAGWILEANRAAEARFGRGTGSLSRRRLSELAEPRAGDDLRDRLGKLDPDGPSRFDTRLVTADGAALDVDMTVRPVTGDGRFRLLVVARDVTEARRAAAERRRAEEFERAIVACSPVALYSVDPEGRVLSWNESAQRVFGWSADEVIGRPLPLVPLESGEEFERLRARVLAGEVLTGVELVRERKDGVRIPVTLSAATLSDSEGRPIGILAAMDDITARTRVAAELAESEARYRSVFENGHAVMLIIDPATAEVVDANPAACDYYGWNREEMHGKPVAEINTLPPGEIRERMEEARTGRRRHFRFRHRRADGSERDVDVYSGPIPIFGRTCLYSVIHDVTERFQAARELEESERRHATLLDNLPGMAYRCRSDEDWTMEFVSRGVESLTGYGAADLVGSARVAYADLIHPDDREFVSRTVAAATDAGHPFELEYRIVRPDGSVRRVWERGRLVAPAGEGPATLEGFVMDVTERSEAAAARDRLLVAIEQLDEAVIVTDAEGTIEYVNAAFERTTGYPRSEAVGRNPRILRSGEHGEDFYEDLWRTITAGRTWQGRLRNRRRDGSLYTEDTTISPVLDEEGRIVGFIAVKLDVTERLELDEQMRQAQKMESIGRLAGGVAHDFNNMLTVILGHAELELAECTPDGRSRAGLEEIREAASRSAELTQQLLAFARRQPALPRRVDLDERIEGMLRMLRRLIGEEIDLAWLPGDGPADVRIDPGQVDQVVANLCLNARDAIRGTGRITIETGTVAFDEEYCRHHAGFVPGEYVMLAVSDDGVGMDEGTRARVFEPYFTTKEAGRGTGLGLATVYGIVKQNGGFVNVYSEPGRGTTFRIYFERYRGAERPEEPRPEESLPVGRGEMILLVEDESRIRTLCAEMLERLGYVVLATATPGEALDRARSHDGKIHLLMTDVILPGMNGRELSDALEEIRPGVPCLYISGYTANVIVHHGVVDPGTHFLQKPFHTGDVARAVRRALDG